ncbi:unnamed protein product [Microthlaspi erraticum]|uniref:Cystatin domain-containing protein n=1 Tax=Microthlaspi erraticum TaxID=1685480 RepID=A0A6D2I9M1_9BRAS|nr:unnamed protein product [Microthlaspi erraticum]
MLPTSSLFLLLPCIRNEDEEPYLTPEEELRRMTEQVEESQDTDFEFVKFIKGNLHETGCPAVMYFITFQGKASSDDEPKEFRAKVCYFCYEPNMYHSCELKPEKKVHFIETEEKEDAKKRRLALGAV